MQKITVSEKFYFTSKLLLSIALGSCLSFSAQALTCEKEFAMRAEKEMKVLGSLAQLEAKVSNLSKNSSSSSISYQLKFKELAIEAKSEVFDFAPKFQLAKNKKQFPNEKSP